MAHHGTTVIPKHEDRILREVKANLRELYGDTGVERRAAEIAALPTVEWKGRTLYTLRCHGTRGKGPHDVNLPESLLWNLIGLTHYCCVYHAGNQLPPAPPRAPEGGPV